MIFLDVVWSLTTNGFSLADHLGGRTPEIKATKAVTTNERLNSHKQMWGARPVRGVLFLSFQSVSVIKLKRPMKLCLEATAAAPKARKCVRALVVSAACYDGGKVENCAANTICAQARRSPTSVEQR